MASGVGRWIVVIACLLIVAGVAGAVTPEDVTYQGVLLNAAGDPLPAPVDLTVATWDQLAGGTRLYAGKRLAVPLQEGVFSILLGTGAPLGGRAFDADLFAAQNRYPEITIKTGSGSSETLQSRQPFRSVAYALKSGGDTQVDATEPGFAAPHKQPELAPGAFRRAAAVLPGVALCRVWRFALRREIPVHGTGRAHGPGRPNR